MPSSFIVWPMGVEVDFVRLIWEDIIYKLNKKTREKVVPYPRFISIILEYMMPEYENDELTLNPTQVFSVHNWALKPNQPEGPPVTDHMKAICNADVPVESQAPKTSSQTEKKVPKAKNKENQSSSAKDKISSHPSASTHVVAEMHKEAQKATGDPTSLGATSEEGTINNNIGELVGLTLNPKAVPIFQQWTIVLYDSEYMQTTFASPLINNHMSLTHLKGLPAGALKLGQDHTQTWVGGPIRSNNHTNTG
ncbi:hypothetical protein Tco_1451541 [Tanacetum coccineum]